MIKLAKKAHREERLRDTERKRKGPREKETEGYKGIMKILI